MGRLAAHSGEIERDYPLEQLRAERRMRVEMERIAREMVRERLDGGGEYERGIEGMQ
jgi:hypothetical protein